jgi:hypothetical protein
MTENNVLWEDVLWEHRCSDGVGGCTAIGGSYLAALLGLLAQVRETKYWRGDADLLLAAAKAQGYEPDAARDADAAHPDE